MFLGSDPVSSSGIVPQNSPYLRNLDGFREQDGASMAGVFHVACVTEAVFGVHPCCDTYPFSFSL